MGRRPHALVQEFFDRGPKLNDNSNRYQHTCKRCGEFFPKGRIDSLTTHVLRRCSNLTDADRIWVSHQLQTDAERTSKAAKRSHADTFPEFATPFNRAYQPDLPHALAQQQQTALETLAEVSGQHSSRADGNAAADINDEQARAPASATAEDVAEQALIAQLQRHVDNSSNLSAAPKAAPNVEQYVANTTSAQQLSVSVSASGSAPMSTPAAPLIETASAANQHLEQTDHLFLDASSFDTINGHAYQSRSAPLDMGLRIAEPNDGTAASHPWPQPAVTHAMPSFGTLTMPHIDPSTRYGVLSSTANQRTRGRFGDERRKEVSQIRKQGACIRCRMLKKPCSGDTPCKTCANVISARIWKGKCLRTKLCDEMTLWSKGAFQLRAQGRLSTISDEVRSRDTPRHVAISVLKSQAQVKLPLKGVRDTGSRDDSTSQSRAQSMPTWILSREDVAGEKLGSFMRKQMREIFDDQPKLLAEALGKAHHLTTAKCPAWPVELDGRDHTGDSKRTDSGSRNDLLDNVLELWALSKILTSENLLQCSFDSTTMSDIWHGSSAAVPKAPSDEDNHELVQMQLFAAMESRCSKLSKIVLNGMERRLMQRQQTSRFATLLAALILLSCVEHMTCYYRSLDATKKRPQHDSPASPAVSDEVINGTQTSDFSPVLPSSIWLQGEQFSDLLTSLLRMRALPPKTKVSSDGTLESIRDFTMPVPQQQHAGEPPSSKKPDEDAAADWIDSLKLQAQPLKEKRDAEVPGVEDGLEAWRLRYVAKVLLP